MQTKSIKIEINLKNNEVVKMAKLNGYAFIESGFLSGEILSHSDDLTLEEQVMLTAFTFTGCPIAARVDNLELNPWLITNGSYNSVRKLVSSDFEVLSELTSEGGIDEITMKLNLNCNGSLPTLSSIKHPFQESISQLQTGCLVGRFDVVFNTTNGNDVLAQAFSKYELNITKNVVPVWRNITILNAKGVSSFVQIEQIDLFGSKIVADNDLKEKSKVVSK